MSTAINLIPEYQDKNNVWHPFFPDKGRAMWFQGNMRDSLARVSWGGERQGTSVDKQSLTEEELKLLCGTYQSKECVGLDENKKPIYEDVERTFDYTTHTRAITLDELEELMDKKQESASDSLKDRVREYKEALNDMTLAKVALCSGTGKNIPDSFTENLYESEMNLENFVSESDYDCLDDYICIRTHYYMLQGFKSSLPYDEVKNVRYLFYIN